MDLLATLQHREITPDDYELLNSHLADVPKCGGKVPGWLCDLLPQRQAVGGAECGICCTDVDDAMILSMACLHEHHYECLRQWLESKAGLQISLSNLMRPWYHGTMAPWLHGAMAPWHHGTMVPGHHFFKNKKTQPQRPPPKTPPPLPP